MKNINAEAFEAFVVKAFKLTNEDLASLYNEAGELTDFSLIEQKDAERIKKLSTDKTNQYNRGLKEGAEKVEKAIKEKYEVESDLIGVELFDHVIETKLSNVKDKSGTDIMAHPEVIKLVNQHSKALKDKDKEKEEAVKKIQSEIESNNLFKQVEDSALVRFESLNPILPADAKKAKALKDILVADLKKNKYQKVGDDYVVLNEDGTPLQDEHGHSITFEDHVKGHAERYFDFKAAEDRSSSGNNNQQNGQSKKVRMPKDEAEYQEMMKDNSYTSKEKIEIKDLFTKKR